MSRDRAAGRFEWIALGSNERSTFKGPGYVGVKEDRYEVTEQHHAYVSISSIGQEEMC